MTETDTRGPSSSFYAQPIRDYSALSREQLERRLSAAEDVVMMFSWTGVDHSDRGKAAHELWRRWLMIVPTDFVNPKNHPHLRDKAIKPLVAERDATRARTLAAIRGETDMKGSS